MASARVSANAGAAKATVAPAVKTAVNRCPRRLFDIPYPRYRREQLVLYADLWRRGLARVTLSFFHPELCIRLASASTLGRVPGVRPTPRITNRRQIRVERPCLGARAGWRRRLPAGQRR